MNMEQLPPFINIAYKTGQDCITWISDKMPNSIPTVNQQQTQAVSKAIEATTPLFSTAFWAGCNYLLIRNVVKKVKEIEQLNEAYNKEIQQLESESTSLERSNDAISQKCRNLTLHGENNDAIKELEEKYNTNSSRIEEIESEISKRAEKFKESDISDGSNLVMSLLPVVLLNLIIPPTSVNEHVQNSINHITTHAEGLINFTSHAAKTTGLAVGTLASGAGALYFSLGAAKQLKNSVVHLYHGESIKFAGALIDATAQVGLGALAGYIAYTTRTGCVEGMGFPQ